MKPVIKWAGGKTQLLNEIEMRIPHDFGRYYEPFIGGGALFLYLEPQRATINDYNFKLTNLYNVIKNNPNELIDRLSELQENHSEDYYFEIRDLFNENILNNEYSIDDAAYFIYLNKMCYNGLYRVNSSGLFNVPSGKKKKASLFDKDNIFDVSDLLQHTTIRTGDFEKACNRARQGDFVFFDSPYYDTFDTYQANGFSKDDHIRLANLFKRLSERGVYCLLTNSDTDFIRSLYQDDNFIIETVEVKRMINCDGNNRTGTEVIIRNYE